MTWFGSQDLILLNSGALTQKCYPPASKKKKEKKCRKGSLFCANGGTMSFQVCVNFHIRSSRNPNLNPKLYPIIKCNYSVNQIWSISHINDLKTLFSLTIFFRNATLKLCTICYPGRGSYKIDNNMKKNRFWKPYPTLLVVYDHFLRVASPDPLQWYQNECITHTWPTWLWKSIPLLPFHTIFVWSCICAATLKFHL